MKTNKQVLLRALCDYNQISENLTTVLYHSLRNHTYPGDSYLKHWMHRLHAFFFGLVWMYTLIFTNFNLQAEIVANGSYDNIN